MAAGGDKQEAEVRRITWEELHAHKGASDLWISIHGKVYDVTAWADHHPGGDLPLLSLGGQDATDAFVAYHPASAWAHLDRQCLVGFLVDYHVSPVSRDYRHLLAELSHSGFFDRKGLVAPVTLLFMLFLLSASVAGVLFSRSAVVHALCGGMMGFLWIQSGWMGHDSGHYRIVPDPRLNRFAQIVTGNCLTGISIAWWKRNHNAHHIACNSLDYDPDLQHIPFFVVSSKLFTSLTSCYYDRKMNFDAISRFLVSYQHWTFYPVMCFARINLFAQSILLLVSKKKVPNRWPEIIGVSVFWIWYPLLVSCLPNWPERVIFVIASFAVTGIQHVQFCLNHFSSSVYVGPPQGNNWFEKQTIGTLNISCSPWMDWFHGGLQFQTEHHLFPRLPRCHLRKISPFVKELCKNHKLLYSSASFWEANKMTLRTLRSAALQARDFTKPVPKNLVWDAVNTHG